MRRHCPICLEFLIKTGGVFIVCVLFLSACLVMEICISALDGDSAIGHRRHLQLD